MNWEIVGISIYVVGMIFMGLYISKKIKNDDDYFLGGRSLGPGLATFSIFATWFGAETCIGTAGAVYRGGLSSIHADPLGYTVCLIVMGIFFAKVLWKRQITTIPDLFRVRFSPSTEKFATFIMIPSSIVWAGAQIRAMGQILHSTTDFGPTIAVIVAASVVIIYTMSGGLLADAYADLIQGIAIIVGLFFLAGSVIYHMGGVEAALSSIPKERLNFFSGGDYEGHGLLGRIELWMVPILGSILSQELVSRVAASRSPEIAQKSAFRASGIYLMVGIIPVLLGLLSVNHMPGLEDAETLMPALAKVHLNYFFYIIFVGALVSAILSTVDTTLLASSALISHNVIYPAFPELSPRKRVLVARSATLLSGLMGFAIAFSSTSITGLVEMASSLGGPSILVVVIIALWVKKGNAVNANIAIASSVIMWFVGHYVLEVDYPVILTVIVCGISYFVTLPLTSKKKDFYSEEEEAGVVEVVN